ncbi:MAG: putative porin [Deltaproteobacteria bacterium]
MVQKLSQIIIKKKKGEKQMSKLLTAIVLVGFMVLSLAIHPSCAGEIDILLQKLVEKGILTTGEAQQIGTETKEQVRKEIAEGKYSSLPAWVQNTKLKGDFRLRYQFDHAKKLAPGTQSTNDIHRARMRLRLSLESKVNEKLLVGIGLATGLNAASDSEANSTNKDTARSPNQTLGTGFAKKPISLDYAFAQYMPNSWVTLIGGKFRNPLWEPGDLIWDTDINPEGGAVKLNKKFGSKTELFINSGVLTIDEGGFGADPTMYVVKPGVNQLITNNIAVKGAFSYYGFSGVKGKKLPGTVGTNSNTGGSLIYNYKIITPAVEISFKDPFKPLNVSFLDVQYLALFGEYVANIDSSVTEDNTGYMFGFKFGNEKIEKWADWQCRYNYAMLGKDSILDILPDSDRYGGKTGMRSHELMFDWGLGKNTWLGLDYYYGWQLPGNFKQTQTKPASVFQVDWNMKF